MKTKKRIFIALAIIFIGSSVFLFNSFYKEAKDIAIAKLNEEQLIHAKQAAQGIEDFFATWTRSLSYLSKTDAVIDMDATGKRSLELFYEANRDQIKSITRLDEKGVILYNFPSRSVMGADISAQKHVRQMLRDHTPVISDVFKAVEGFDAIALHVPVFRGPVFKGSIGILIDFESIARRYLDVIKIGKTGYAWVVSRDGTQLYSPIPGFTGKSVFINIKDFPSLIVMVNDMLKGHTGAATYSFDRIGARSVGQIRKYAVYMPAQVGNTFWSIVVASAEQDVLSGLVSFRNKLILVLGALFIFGMAFSILGAKAWFIVKEVEGRRQAEERYQKLFEKASDGIIFLTGSGTIVAANESFAKMHGYTKEEIFNMKLKDLDTPETLKLAEGRMQRILGGETLKFATEHYHKDGHIFPLEVVSNLLGDGPEKLIVAFHRDLTERKQAEKETAQLRLEVAHLGRVMMMSELATSLAHEINQPLGAIMNNASAAQSLSSQSKQGNEEVSEILADIINDTKRAGDVVRKIRGIVKKDVAQFEKLDINTVIEDVISLFQNNIIMHNVSLHLDLHPDLAAVRGDRTRLQQVLVNLITNAFEAMMKSPVRTLTIRSTLRGPDMIMASVSDSGIGINDAQKDKAFEPFFTTKKDGLGMGLRICRSIIEEHGGKIWIEDNPGTGVTFSFSLKALREGSA